MPAKYSRTFETATFGVQVFEDCSRWYIVFENGTKRFSFNTFRSAEEAGSAIEHYIPLCQARKDKGLRYWVVERIMSPKTGMIRNVFTDASS